MSVESIDRFFDGAGVPCTRLDERRWVAQLQGERKLTIPLSVTINADVVTFESFFMRRPQENLDRFYDLILRRNARAYGVHFALDAIGDVYLVGQRALAGLDEAEMDRIVGSLLIEADGMFDRCIEIGFATYLEADRRWRAREAGSS